MDISPLKIRPQFAAKVAANKGAVATAIHVQSVQEQRDRVAKTVTAAPALDETRQNLNVTDTYTADDTFANTEAMKIRGGRLDLVI